MTCTTKTDPESSYNRLTGYSQYVAGTRVLTVKNQEDHHVQK